MNPISTSADGIRVPARITNGACRTPRLCAPVARVRCRWTSSASAALSLRACPSVRSARMPFTGSSERGSGITSGPPFSSSASMRASASVGSGERK
jgi:hypothetical protein